MNRASSDSLTPTSGSEVADRLLVEQVVLLCRFAFIPLVGSIFIGGILCWILLDSDRPSLVWAWYVGLIVMTAIRAAVGRLFLARKRSASEARRFRNILLVAVSISGGLWGAAAMWLIPDDPTRQVLASLFFVGAVASGVATLSPVKLAYPAMLVPFLGPVAIQHFMLGGSDHMVIGYGTVLFALMMLYISRTYRTGVKEILHLRLANEVLATRLADEKDLIAGHNEALEREIAERKRAESQLLAAKADAEAANRAKSQFLANISHEVRTPMNAMLGMTELLTRTQLDAKQRRFAQVALDSGQRLLHLINDILDLSRIEAGKLKLAQAEFSPRQLLQEVVDLMGAQVADKGLELAHTVEPSVPDQVRGDPDRLRQVLVNLVSNAIKFTERGGVSVELRMADRGADDEASRRAGEFARLRWTVKDTGIGVAPDAHQRLFQPFSQADDSTTRRFGGTGLGLAISRQVVEAMNGRIGVVSEVGHGASFWFEVALERVQAVHRPEAREPLSPLCQVSGRVLIAEDNAVNRAVLSEMLTMLGIAVSAVENGADALAQIERQSFDLVFMDWHMPVIDGLEATRRIRAREAADGAGHRVAIVALTASAMAGDRDICINAGMDDYIPKPFTFDEIMAVLQRWLPAATTRVVA